MPLTISYPRSTKLSFIAPRSPPLPPTYNAPVFERTDIVKDKSYKRIGWIPDTVRNHLIAMIGEFVGTLFFLFFSFAAVQTANTKTDNLPRVGAAGGPSLLQIAYISFAFGLSLMVNVWVFFRVSGGMFNPAVTIALTLIAGGIMAAALVSILFPGALDVANTLGTKVSVIQGLFIEVILTAMLIFTILMLAVEKHRATPLAPLGIGATLTLVHLIGINYTGTSVNPVRSLSPNVITGQFTSYHWIYWLGPISGAIFASAFYGLIKFLDYETANPGQDDDSLPIYRVVQGNQQYQYQYQGRRSIDSLTPLAYSQRLDEPKFQHFEDMVYEDMNKGMCKEF